MKTLLIVLIFCSSITFARDIKVLIIDTGVDLTHIEIRNHVNMKYWTDYTNYFDGNYHGTHIAGLIVKDICPEVVLESCRYYDLNNGQTNFTNSLNCFKTALKGHYDVINYSSSGTDESQAEYNAIKLLSDKGTIIVVAAGNNGLDLGHPHNKSYPAKYGIKNVIVVGNLDGDKRNVSSNYGLKGMVWENGTNVLSTFPGGKYGRMTGTSQSTAIYTNRILKGMCNEKK
jgi:major intracellular serine protease